MPIKAEDKARSSWRKEAAERINEVLRARPGAPIPELKAALRDAYPWGERASYPYDVWSAEVRHALAIREETR